MTKQADIFVDGHRVGWIDVTIYEGGVNIPPQGSVPFEHLQPDQEGSPDNPDVHEGGAHRGRRPGEHHHDRLHKRPEEGPTFRPGIRPRGKAPPEHPPHFTTDDVKAALQGRLKGSDYLKAERSPQAKELAANPKLRRYLKGVLAHEQSYKNSSQVFEAMLNRINYKRAHGQPNYTIEDELHSGFYGPIKHHLITEDWVRRTADGPANEILDEGIDRALGGSNQIRGFTDQGSGPSRGKPADPNWHKGEYLDLPGGESYNDWNQATKQWRLQQQKKVAEGGYTATGGPPTGVTRLGADTNYRSPEEAAEASAGGGPTAYGNVPSPVSGTIHQGPGAARRGHTHAGVDIFTPVGTPVHASWSGRVVAGHYSPGITGGIVDVQYDNGLFGRYMHLSNWSQMPIGARVNAGDVVGLSGNPPGTTNMPHLHYEIHQGRGGRVLDPAVVHGWGRFGSRGEGLFGTRVSSAPRPAAPSVVATRVPERSAAAAQPPAPTNDKSLADDLQKALDQLKPSK